MQKLGRHTYIKADEIPLQRVILQKNTSYKDDNGFSKMRWVNHYTLLAGIKLLDGREYWEAKQCNSEETIQFKFPNTADLEDIDTKKYRISYNNKLYNITQVDTTQDTKLISLKATEVSK